MFGILSLWHPFRRNVRVVTQTMLAHVSSSADTPFPVVNTEPLSVVQRRIVSLNQQEYAKRPISYDADVLKYTQNSKEAWCADYASWILAEAGQPLRNPNSGSWRIPGVYTLQDYFRAKHRYMTVGSYQPKVGDLAIYGHGAGHVAIVLKVQGRTITTIGGNESGRLRIDTRPETGRGNYDLIGFGTLATPPIED